MGGFARDAPADFQFSGPSLIPLPLSTRAKPIRRFANGKAMSGPEFDPFRAFADTPRPRQNPWQDEDEEPRPEFCPVGPTILGIQPSPAMNAEYAAHNAKFIRKARKGI